MKFCNDDRKHFRAVAVKPTIYLKDDVGGGGAAVGGFCRVETEKYLLRLLDVVSLFYQKWKDVETHSVMSQIF